MTSVGTGTTTTSGSSKSAAADLVGCSGEGLWKNKWYPCIVKKDNQDGTIKVQWDNDDKKTCILVSSRFPVEKFRLEKEEEEPAYVPTSIFGPLEIGDY